ncbi:MAG TPA: O-antigen ligase family protein, partial [bacterium]
MSAFLLSFGGPFLHRLVDSVLHLGQSLATSRLHIWRPAVSIAMANPLTGVGLDTFKIAFPYYSGIEFNQIDGMFMSSRMAHNQLLQMAATTGFLGLATYLGVLGAFGFLWWKGYRAAQPSGQWILIAVLSSATAYHVQNFFSFGVATIDLLWFFFLAIVQNFYLKYSPISPISTPRIPNSFSTLLKRIVILSLIIFLLLFPLRRLGADIAYGHGNAISEYLKSPSPQAASSDLIYYSDAEIHYLKKAVQLFPLEVKYELYLGLANEQRAHLKGDQTRDWYLEALHCYQKSAEMSPANAYYYNDEGRVLTALSQFEPNYLLNAEEAYGKSVKWAPASPAFLINWSDVLNKLGRKKEALIELNKAFQLDSAFSAKVLAQMALDRYRSGDKKEAFQYLDEAAVENTSCAEVFYCRGIL